MLSKMYCTVHLEMSHCQPAPNSGPDSLGGVLCNTNHCQWQAPFQRGVKKQSDAFTKPVTRKGKTLVSQGTGDKGCEKGIICSVFVLFSWGSLDGEVKTLESPCPGHEKGVHGSG
jgi:hypothetical protein